MVWGAECGGDEIHGGVVLTALSLSVSLSYRVSLNQHCSAKMMYECGCVARSTVWKWVYLTRPRGN